MQIQDAVANYDSSAVTLTTTTEKDVILSPLARCYRNSGIAMIWAWAQLTTGTGTTSVNPKIRKGTAITDTLITESNIVTIGAAAGSNEQYMAVAMEQLTSEQVAQYLFTLTQAGASGNGTVLQAGIIVLIV